MFAAIDNTVTLPGYAGDGGVRTISRQLRLRVNVENLFNASYSSTRTATPTSARFPARSESA